MTLDEAIKHCEEVAEENENVVNTGMFKDGYTVAEIYCDDTECINAHLSRCTECAEEHRQLAEWLKELKDYKERMPSYEAGYNDAKREIALSGEYERAYERGKADAQTKTGHWFIDERPESDREIICSNCEQPVFRYHKIDFDYRPKYCPNCGCRMIEPQESEDKE